jgi:hypothetical protein
MSMEDELLINSGTLSVEIIQESIVDRNKFCSSHFRILKGFRDGYFELFYRKLAHLS